MNNTDNKYADDYEKYIELEKLIKRIDELTLDSERLEIEGKVTSDWHDEVREDELKEKALKLNKSSYLTGLIGIALGGAALMFSAYSLIEKEFVQFISFDPSRSGLFSIIFGLVSAALGVALALWTQHKKRKMDLEQQLRLLKSERLDRQLRSIARLRKTFSDIEHLRSSEMGGGSDLDKHVGKK